METLTTEKIDVARDLYAQFLRVLLGKQLITPDDYENWQQICPLFDPCFVNYKLENHVYEDLAEVQRSILAGCE